MSNTNIIITLCGKLRAELKNLPYIHMWRLGTVWDKNSYRENKYDLFAYVEKIVHQK